MICKTAILLSAAAMLTAGCLSTAMRLAGMPPSVRPYESTVDVGRFVTFYPCWSCDDGYGKRVGFFVSLALFVPCAVDLPLEFLEDTVFLPSDIIRNREYERNCER